MLLIITCIVIIVVYYLFRSSSWSWRFHWNFYDDDKVCHIERYTISTGMVHQP